MVKDNCDTTFRCICFCFFAFVAQLIQLSSKILKFELFVCVPKLEKLSIAASDLLILFTYGLLLSRPLLK